MRTNPSLLTAGDKPKASMKTIPRKPLTTRGKTLRALAVKESKNKSQPREAPPTLQTDGEPVLKKSKARSFAPPDELDYIAEQLKKRQLAKARGENRAGWNKKPLLTTQQKIKGAQAIRQAKGGLEDIATIAPKGKGKGPGLGLMTILKGQDKSFLGMTGEGRKGREELSWGDIKSKEEKRKEEEDGEKMGSVLFRPTLRARKWRAMYGVKEFAVKEKRKEKQDERAEETQPSGPAEEVAKASASASQAKTDPAPAAAAGWFHPLPDEVRARIWKLAVVDNKICIWPTSPTGREQPDLSKTCKQIRHEVLPLYYGLNTFGISLQKEALNAQQQAVKIGQKRTLTGMAAVHKWARTIGNEDAKWVAMIRDWAFEYLDPAGGWGGVGEGEDDDSFVVSVRVEKGMQDRPAEGGDRLEEAAAEAGDEVPGSASSPDVEVHLEASCFLRGWAKCGKCRTSAAPAELDAAVEWMLEAGVSAGTLYKFANELRGMLLKLSRARCVRSGRGRSRS